MNGIRLENSLKPKGMQFSIAFGFRLSAFSHIHESPWPSSLIGCLLHSDSINVFLPACPAGKPMPKFNFYPVGRKFKFHQLFPGGLKAKKHKPLVTNRQI
jgi:hypothetical protein